MFQINTKLLDALLEEIVMGKPLAKKLLEEANQKIEANEQAGKKFAFREIMREVVGQHRHELRSADDFRKGCSLISKYFLTLGKMRREKRRLEQCSTQEQAVAPTRKPDEQLELFGKKEVHFLSKERFSEILFGDYYFSKYYGRP